MDDCVACHMPTADTEVPHVAFSHHRVGLHRKAPPTMRARPAEFTLVPVDDESHVDPQVRERNLALAYFKHSLTAQSPDEHQTSVANAARILQGLFEAGYRDPDALAVSSALAKEPELSQALATEAIEFVPRPAVNYLITAYQVLIGRLFGTNELETALARLRELTRIRRNASDWLLRAEIHRRLDQPDEAREALEHALGIHPASADVQRVAAEIYGWLGDESLARDHAALGGAIERRLGVDPWR
jgi:tetratricopeptide (TPR) repeat protein